ncbi:hypothetical protein HYFRA_00011729 [Hymenoscyphus fraxineus]|uniref:Uncharacterized protein n=1 Tax=Hymenoscyphus fraxineus TaxID=746836 RepID=A0A9N9L462_9HELO|nr:hypothetical protein HYFRA_00011729 [Hymenoscyphus fraxineus]
MFISSLLAFSCPHTHYPKITLKDAARQAWKKLRFEVPELGIRAVINDGEFFLESKMLDEAGVRGWISMTLFFGESKGDYEFESLRKDIASRKDCEEQASILLNFETQDSAVFGNGGEELVDGVHLILNTDHQITDGIGTRILLGGFLELFSQFSKTATITHAVYAAMLLTLLCPPFQQSPSQELSTFNFSCWFNGRRYLMPAQQNSYIPPCQSFFPISFTDLQDLRMTKDAGREERRELMLRALGMSMGQYLALKEEGERGIGLCSTITFIEEIGRTMRGKKVAKEEDERDKGNKMEHFAVPSDGITETYIVRSYPNTGRAILSENEGDKMDQIEAGRQDILVVRDVHFGANAGDEVFVPSSCLIPSQVFSFCPLCPSHH